MTTQTAENWINIATENREEIIAEIKKIRSELLRGKDRRQLWQGEVHLMLAGAVKTIWNGCNAKFYDGNDKVSIPVWHGNTGFVIPWGNDEAIWSQVLSTIRETAV